MYKNFQNEKDFWQKYTDHDLSEEDIFEINYNLQNFAKTLSIIYKEIKEKE